MRQQPIDLVRQRGQVSQIHQPDGAAADLVFVGRTDAALRGADGGGLVGIFADGVELAMQRQDQRYVFGDAQIFRTDGDALRRELCDLIEERLRIEHDAVADHRELRGPQHARRQQRQLVGFAVDDERVAGIVAALKAHDDVGLLRQPVDDLALPLVAPLGADDDNIGHFAKFPCNLIRPRQNTALSRSHARHLPDKGSGCSAQAGRAFFAWCFRRATY